MDMRTWRDSHSRAVDATTALREGLAALGVPEPVQQRLRPLVTHSGTALVHVGTIRAEDVELIAEALRGAAGAQRLTAVSGQETGA